MKHIHPIGKTRESYRQRQQRGVGRGQAARRGSTLLIVIALLGLLSLLGFVFYTFAAQERSNAEYFSEAAKGETDPGLSADTLFDWGLEQLIVGPPNYLKQSALWGKRHALISQVYGRDLTPHTGEGVDPSNPAHVALGLLNPIDSPAVRGGFERNWVQNTNYPDPAVDYTYPDINNMFLGYFGQTFDNNNNSTVTIGSTTYQRHVMVPSFVRPELLRSGGAHLTDWYQNPLTTAKTFRPHPRHVYIDGQDNNVRRFLDANNPADMTIITGLTGGSSGFPFEPADLTGGNAAVKGEMGVWSNSVPGIYELDADNDNDPTNGNEGIWMDLAFYIQERDDGAMYTPLHSMTVYDADGLFNLNIHGNLAGNLNLAAARFGGPGQSRVAESNTGVGGPSEVNPLWAFTTNPGAIGAAAFGPHQTFFGHVPADRGELANMEWWFLNMGRAEYSGGSVSDLIAGRWGELNRLSNGVASMNLAQFPGPGVRGLDDDYNQLNGEAVAGAPGFGQPMDYRGGGRYVQVGNYKVPNLVRPITGNPSRWLRYDQYHTRGTVQWRNTLGGTLMTNVSASNPLIDDPLEIIVDPDHKKDPFDEPFGPQDMAILHLRNSDINSAEDRPETRVPDLAPVNFSTNGATNAAGSDIRSRFTTLSWDQKSLNFPGFGGALSVTRGEVTNIDGRGTYLFPPRFGSVQLSTTVGAQTTDPFRTQLRRLLEIRAKNKSNFKRQFRLGVHGVLDVERQPNRPGDQWAGPLVYRPLTPHPTNGSITVIPPVSPLPPFPPTTASEQEFWARFDRQKMARDIYVMLYTLGGGSDTTNYTGTNDHSNTMTPSNPADLVYTTTQLREMAQFAVNLVDALDRDNVITAFEYDRNLGDTPDPMNPMTVLRSGWNLDDDAYTSDAGPEERAVVYGVEAQQLTISESLGITSAQIGGMGLDHQATMYDDTTQKRQFVYVELRNASPFSVALGATSSTSANRGVWRIRRDDDNQSTIIGDENACTFLAGAGTIAPGGQFVIGSSDGSDVLGALHRSSDFRVNYAMVAPPGEYHLIAPRRPDFGTVPDITTVPSAANGQPKCDLDLVHGSHAGRFQLNSGPIGAFPRNVPPSTNSFDIVLERRQNPTLLGAGIGQNAWVEVDRTTVRFEPFNIKDGTTALQISDQNVNTPNNDLLNQLKSRERSEPFRRRTPLELQFNGSIPAFNDGIRYSTLGHQVASLPVVGSDRNSRSPAQFSVWQPHFDRDFLSIGELMAVPLYGPANATRYLYASRTPPRSQSPARVAGAKILQPQPAGNTNTLLNNRWYRLFEFWEVPTPTHRELGNPLNVKRVPGKVNPNTIRHPEVLAGLIDDPEVYTRNLTNASLHLPSTDGGDQNLNGGRRDWWAQFIRSRDTRDSTTGLFLPGMTGSNPFRSLSFVGNGNASIDNTLLRGLPIDLDDGNSGTNRRLFELGRNAEHSAGSVDFYTRHRLLSKVLNNATTRSNVFIVYMSVEFFEVYHDVTNNAYRIGGKFDVDDDGDLTNDGHRGFFVIDRSDAEQAYDPSTRTFDWRKMVKHRTTIH